MESLKNKVVLITGASSGIGKACAFAFAKEGANLILAARRLDKLKAIASSITKEYNSKILAIELDVKDNQKVKSVISNLSEEWKQIDLLINNAGLARGFSRIYDGETEHWEEMIDTNII